MFNKQNLVDVVHEDAGEHNVEIKVDINGKVQAPEFRISIGGRDVIMVNSREYRKNKVMILELTREILRHIDADSLIHGIAAVHASEKHDIEELLNGLGVGA